MKKSGLKIFSWLFYALLFVAALGAVAYFVFRKPASSQVFSLTVGENVFRHDGIASIVSGEKIVVEGAEEYSVSVYGFAGEADFDFRVGERAYRWSDTEEIDFVRSGDIALDKAEDGFTLTFGSLAEIVGGGEPVLFDLRNLGYNLFRLSVSTEEETISLYFRDIVDCNDVVLPSEIVF